MRNLLLAKLAIVLLGAEEASKLDWNVQTTVYRDGGDWWETISLKNNKVIVEEGREFETFCRTECTPMEFLTNKLTHHKALVEKNICKMADKNINAKWLHLYDNAIKYHSGRVSEILSIKEWLFQNNYSG